MADVPIGTPDWWLHRLVERLMSRQDRYTALYRYSVGEHPTPPGDEDYADILRDLIRFARTNYVGLAIRATTERMRVKDFKFGTDNENVDEDAKKFWVANNMDLLSSVGINDAATFGESYAMVSPPDENDKNKIPIITMEDPRQCITEPDPLRPMRSLAGLKMYEDFVLGKLVCILILPKKVFVYHGPLATRGTQDDMDGVTSKLEGGASAAGFELVNTYSNELGEVFLVRGPWQPEHGPISLSECENGALDIQDRINFTILARLVIAHNQAYRQRWATGVEAPVNKKGQVKPPFDPGSDKVWITSSDKAKFGDFEQADITQLLEAARDDIGDFAAITQTPVTYLTNRMVNVSGDALTSAQASLVSKVRLRQKAMGWYFQQIIKLCFRYQDDERADEVFAETIWADPEIRGMAEIADMVGKFAAAGIPLALILERAGFSATEIEFAVAEAERMKQQEMEQAQQQMDMQTKSQIAVQKAAPKPAVEAGSKPAVGAGKPAARKPAAKKPSSPQKG